MCTFKEIKWLVGIISVISHLTPVWIRRWYMHSSCLLVSHLDVVKSKGKKKLLPKETGWFYGLHSSCEVISIERLSKKKE